MLVVPPTEWLLALGTVLVVAVALGVRSYRARDRPGANAFSAMMAGIFVWCLTYALQLFATTESTFLAFLRVEYLATVFVPVAWLVFVLEYTGRGHLVNRRSVLALCAFPVAVIVAVWTNPLHHVMWTERSLAGAGGLGASTLNWGFWAYFAYEYLLLAAALLFLLEVVVDQGSQYRLQAAVLVVAELIPLSFQVLHLVGPAWASTVNLTPFSFVLSGAIALAALERVEFLVANPVAARIADDRVVSQLDDGVIVADGSGDVVDANPAACRLLDSDLGSLRGEAVDACVPSLSSIPDIEAFGAETLTWEVDGEERHLQVSATSLETSRGKQSGRVVTMHDVTPQLRRQKRTEVLNRVLRETLRDEMDVVSSRATDAAFATSDEGDEMTAAATADIRERASEALAVGDVAEEFETLLDRSASFDPVDVVPTVQAEADALRDAFPGLAVTVDAPLGEWAYCDGLFEPTVRALMRFGADRATEAAGEGEMTVDVELVGETAVRVTLQFGAGSTTETHRRVLVDGVDTDADVDVDSPPELSCWLVHWGVERIGGTVAADADVVSMELPRHGDPDA